MNQRERDDLLQFLQPLLRTRATDKDFAAEILILDQCARQPDALYLLVQRAMTLESALEAAQARIAEQQGALAADTVTQDATRDTTLARAGTDDRSGAWGRGLCSAGTRAAATACLGTSRPPRPTTRATT